MPSRKNSPDPEVSRQAACIARAHRYGNTEEESAARAALKAALLRRDIRAALATAPPLSEATRHELAALLVPAPLAESSGPTTPGPPSAGSGMGRSRGR
jgi:hypothetical protein